MLPLQPSGIFPGALGRPQEPWAETQPPERLQHRRLLRAAQEFEAMLLAAWWEQMQTSFPGRSETDQEAGSDTFGWLGLQAMSAAVASAGGLGIARMLAGSLEPFLNRGEKGMPASTD